MKRIGLWGLAIIANGLLAVPILLLFSEPTPSQQNHGHTIEFFSLSVPTTTNSEQGPSKKTPQSLSSKPRTEQPMSEPVSEPVSVSKPVSEVVPLAKSLTQNIASIKESISSNANLQQATVQKKEAIDDGSSSHQHDKETLAPSPSTLTDNIANKNKPAKIITKNEPDYPSRARKRGIEGYVTVEFLVDRNGHVGHIKILQEKPAGIFNQVAIEAVKKWHFQPAFKSGQTVPETVTQTIYFQLN